MMHPRTFRNLVYRHALLHGRTYPWRRTTNPYRILVSEIMLQQTQTHRVVPKYREFVRAYPTVRSLAAAPLRDVLAHWQGLGYNRRARALHACAATIVREYRGRFPRTYHELLRLPGVGPYTAGAVMAFAYNAAVPIIETNIRTVYLHHFFAGRDDVTDRDILESIERTLDRRNPRRWYAALMDYGHYLKGTIGNQNTRSRHYTRQQSFVGSDRQVRGALIRALIAQDGLTEHALARAVQVPVARVRVQCAALMRDGLIVRRGRRHSIAEAT